MKIIIPMAGLGSRFQRVADTNPEYLKPKPLINVRGLPMVRWATGALPFLEHVGQKVDSPIKATTSDLIFIILKKHNEEHDIENELKKIYTDDIRVIVIPELTRGASETAYQTKPYIDQDEEIIITDSDHYFDGKVFEETIITHRVNDVHGVIPAFIPPNDNIPRWSYSLTKEGSTEILKVGEKDRDLMESGAYANIGAYYFSKSKYFFEMFEKIERENKMFGEEGKKEFYVAPLYQEMLNEGKHFHVAILDEVWGLGTPEDLNNFLLNSNKQTP